MNESTGPGYLREGVHRACRLLTTRNLLLVIIALALWWRLVYVAEVPVELRGDETSYNSIAVNLLDGKGYLNSRGEVPVAPPVYPTFVAGVYGASSRSIMAVRIAQAVIGAATIAVIYVVGRKVFNPATGLVAALLAAAYPWFIFWNRFLITETLFIFVLSLSVLAMLWAVEKPALRNLALTGFLLALANLTHSTVPLLPVLFAVWLLLALGLRRGAKAAGLLLVAFFLTLFPWTLRNYIHYGEIIPVAAHGGENLYYANNPFTIPDEPHYSFSKDVDPSDLEEVEGKPSLEKDRVLRNKAINFIIDNPRTVLSNGLKRVRVLWESVPAPPVFNMPLLRSEHYAMNIDYVIGVMFVLGAIAALARWRTAMVLLLVPLQFSLLHLLFPVMGNGRSRVVTMQVAIILAAFAVYTAWRMIVLAPEWASAIRTGVKEHSLQSTWRLIRHPRRS